MSRYIRYKENNEWKYASVKDVGDISKLKTLAKTDVVTAINSLIDGGMADVVDEQIKQAELIKTAQDLINTLNNEVEAISTVGNELKGKVADMESEIGSKVNVEDYEKEYEDVTSKLRDKADLTEFQKVGKDVDNLNVSVENINGALEQKVSRTTYEHDLGLNKWVASKYEVAGTDFDNTAPSFSLIKGLNAKEVNESPDASSMVAFAGDNIITHYFTNVNLKDRKTVYFNVVHEDSLTIYMNGAKIYENAHMSTIGTKVALGFNAGWNTVDILHGNRTGAPVMNLGVKLSTQVDKLTAVIGVGDKNDARLREAETSLKQTEDSIKLMATKDEVTELGNKVESQSSSMEVLSDAIKSKVETERFNEYSNRLETAESSVEILEGKIVNTVEKKDFDELNDKYSTQQTKLEQLDESIELKASDEKVDKLNGRVEVAEGALKVANDKISLTVTELDNLGKKTTAIEQDAGKIRQSVTDLSKSVTQQGTAIEEHNTSITLLNKSIALKAEADKVYTIEQANGKITESATKLKSEIEVTTKGISQTVTDVKKDVDGMKTTVESQGTQIKQTAEEIAINVVKKGNVKTSINASAEGVKILGKHLDITGAVTFQSLDPAMQGKVNAGTDAKDKIDGMQFGAKNIVRKKQISPINVTSSSYDEATNTWTLTANSGAGGSWGAGVRIIDKTSVVPIGSWFAVSFEIYSPIDTTWNADVNNFPVTGTSTSNDNDDTALRQTSSKSLKANTWTKCWFTWKNKDNYTSDLYDQSNIGLVNNSGAPVTFKIRNVKGELGNVVTDYSLAQEDIDEAIARVQGNLDNMSVGGRNIFLNAGLLQGATNWYSNVAQTAVVDDGEDKAFKFTPNTGAGRAGIYQRLGGGSSATKVFEKDQEYTVSVMMKASTGNHKLHIGAESIDVKTVDVDTTWREYSHTFKGTGVGNGTVIFYTTALANGVEFYVKRMKLEKGNRKTDFTLAPEDYDKLVADVDKKAQSSQSAIADMSNDNKATPLEKQQLKKEWATIVAEKPQYEALATIYGITTEKTNYVNAYNTLNTAVTPIIANTTVTSDINGATFRNTFDDYYDKMSQLVKKINELARTIGTNADSKAQTAQNSIADMSSDSKITPVEKVQLKKEWAVMVAEKPQFEALGNGFGVTTEKNNYVNAYNTLNTALNGSGGILTNMTTTSSVTGATFRAQFDDYYDRKSQLVRKINELSRTLTQGLNGKVLYSDPMFKNGLNDVKVYNNSANTNVTVTRVAKPSDAPTNSTHVLEIKSLALPISPAYGGFSFQTASRANAIFITRIVAKIPVGSKLVFASNSTGTGGKQEWLTPTAGTGKWEEYLFRIECGSAGTFSSTNFFNLEGGTLPLTWHVAYATVIDATDYDYSITDMSNDNKLTPLEKQQLKKEWATISAEKPQYEALSNTFGITTEKTNYVNSYNALNTLLSPLISNITITSDVNGQTFRNTFDDYYDKKAQLVRKINELSRSIGTGADAKAQEAKNSIADMSSDSKITPVEKVQLKKEWAVMLSEKPQYEVLATTYGITTEKTNFVNSYNTLNTVLNGTGGILTNMTTTSAVTGATFRGQFDDYYDKKAQLVKVINQKAKSLADGAQGTANTANNTANTANNAINSNKATWDRASNINSNGTFNSSKLSGTILDAQISSASNWNGAKSLLDSWKSGTTLINGGKIATNTIFAQQIAIGDFTNLSQINEEKNPNGYPTVLLSNKRFFKIGNGAYASLTIMDNTYVEFKVNDEYYIAFNGYRDAGVTSLNLIMRYHYTDGTWVNAGAISALPTTADTRVIKNLKITTAPDDTKTISRIQLFFEKDGGTSGYYYIRDIEVRKRYTGELIVDGSIKAQQLDVASLFAHTAFINNLKSQNISGDKVVGGTIKGVTYQSINASNPKIKAVIEGNTFKSYGASDGTKQNYAELKEGLVKVFEMAESGSPFGDKGTAIQPSVMTVTHGSRNTKVFPSILEFSVGSVKSTVEFQGLSNGSGAGLMFTTESGIEIHGKNADEPAIQFQSYQSAIINGWGNIVGNPNSDKYATWSIKDANGRVKFLTGIGKNADQSTEINAYGGGISFNQNGSRLMGYWIQGANYMQQYGTHAIFKYQQTMGRFETRNGNDTDWARLAGIIENTSSRDYKKNISAFERSALDIINASKARLYHYNSQDDSEKLNIGLIAEEAPKLIQGKDGKTVDGYGMTTLAWKAIQELSEQVRYLKNQLNNR